MKSSATAPMQLFSVFSAVLSLPTAAEHLQAAFWPTSSIMSVATDT